MIGFGFPGLVVLFMTIPSIADPPVDGDLLASGIDQFERAYRAWDRAELEGAADTLKAACTKTPRRAAAWHWLGLARFHILVHREGDGSRPLTSDEFGDLTGSAREALKKAVEIDKTDAEAHALLGTLGGMEIMRTPYKALWLGPAVWHHMQIAGKYGENNPRVQYLLGAALIKGSDSRDETDKALVHLERAETLFQSEAAHDVRGWPTRAPWGREHCLALIGQVYAGRGDIPKAIAYYDKALDLNPAHGLARRCLDALQKEDRDE